MFQIGGLIVFCGLLALPLPVALSPTGLTEQLTGAVENGLLSGGLLDSVKNLPILDILKNDGGASGGLIGKLLQQLVNPLRNFTGIEITKPKLLEIGIQLSDDGHGFYLNIPLGFDVKLRMFLVKLQVLKLSVKLNVTVEVLPKKDENGVHLVLGDCSQAPVNLEISLPDGTQTVLIQRLINRTIDTLSQAIPKLVLDEVCSRLNSLLSLLDVSLMQKIVNTLIPEKDIIINI